MPDNTSVKGQIRVAHHLANELTSGLDPTPSCNELSVDDGSTGTRELANEAFVGYNATVQVDFCKEAESGKEMPNWRNWGDRNLTVTVQCSREGGKHGNAASTFEATNALPDGQIVLG